MVLKEARVLYIHSTMHRACMLRYTTDITSQTIIYNAFYAPYRLYNNKDLRPGLHPPRATATACEAPLRYIAILHLGDPWRFCRRRRPLRPRPRPRPQFRPLPAWR